MHRAGHEVSVVSLIAGGHHRDRLEAAGIPVSDLGMWRAASFPAALVRLVWHLRRRKPDVLQSWLHHADLMALLASALAPGPFLYWNVRCSHLNVKDHGRTLFAIIRLLARFSHRPAAIVANASGGRTFHESIGYRPRRWEIIPNALDTDTFRPSDEARRAVRAEFDLADDQPLVGLVARYHPMKDHGTFLRAAKRVLESFPDARFVMAGPGVDSANAALMALVAETGTAANVHVLGPRTDVARLQAAWDVAVCSSYSEGFPNVVGEAMSCAVPCVSTDVGDVRLLMGETGRIVPPAQPEALAAAVCELLEATAAERAELGRRARQRVVDRFSVEAACQRYVKLYEVAEAS